MNKKEFEKAGYIHYNPAPLDGECVTSVYQRSFNDKNGNKKYFLTWKEWDFSQYADALHQDLKNRRYEADTQLTYKKNGQTLDLTFLDGWSVEDAEGFMKALFKLGWFEKYDRDPKNDDDDDGMTRTWVIREDGSLWWE